MTLANTRLAVLRPPCDLWIVLLDDARIGINSYSLQNLQIPGPICITAVVKTLPFSEMDTSAALNYIMMCRFHLSFQLVLSLQLYYLNRKLPYIDVLDLNLYCVLKLQNHQLQI